MLFLTGNPEDCVPVTPLAVVLTKPFDAQQVGMAYRTLMEERFGSE